MIWKKKKIDHANNNSRAVVSSCRSREATPGRGSSRVSGTEMPPPPSSPHAPPREQNPSWSSASVRAGRSPTNPSLVLVRVARETQAALIHVQP